MLTHVQAGGQSLGEAWLLTFGMGHEVVSEGGVGAAGARGSHAPRPQSQQLCSGDTGQDRTETKKSNKRQAGKELPRKEGEKKKKGIEQLGFWKEGRRGKKTQQPKRLKTHQRARKC